MWYGSERLEIKVMSSGNILPFRDIKVHVSLGVLITAGKMHPVFCKNRYFKVSTTANN